jgi:diguanylate cyclase (GGDEF)-like protein
MLFLSMEYQLFLIITLVFSSFIFINSLIILPQSSSSRAFGITFSLPLFLTVRAYLIAPYQKTESEALLFSGYILLIFLCTIIVLLKQKSDYLKLFFVIPFIVILITVTKPCYDIYSKLASLFGILVYVIAAINMSLAVRAAIRREKCSFQAYTGLFMIAVFLCIWMNLKGFSSAALLLLVLGYVSCEIYIYQNTLGAFFKEYNKNAEDLKRYNSSIQMEVSRRVQQIEKSNKKLLEKSKVDSMTGFYIKTAFMQSLETELERLPQTVLSIIMFDIDNFKYINDSEGHQVGDRCIKNLSGLAKTSFRKDDVIGRYGGDEFLVLLPETAPVKAYLIAERFRQYVQTKSSPQITISIGISNYPFNGNSADELIEAADKALYASKHNGRNKVTSYSSLKG